MTALELLQNLNLLDETERIEAKRASEAGKWGAVLGRGEGQCICGVV